MFRSPYCSFRLPDLDDGNIPGAVRDLFTDIEYEVGALDRYRIEATRLNGVRIRLGAPQAIPDATSTIVNFTSEEFDTDGYADLGTFPQRITVPAGVWLVAMDISIYPAAAAPNTIRAAVYGSVGGMLCTNGSGPYSGSTSGGPISAMAPFATTGEYIYLSAFQFSGSAGSISWATMTVTHIADL